MYDKNEQRKVSMHVRCFVARSNCLDVDVQMPYNKVMKYGLYCLKMRYTRFPHRTHIL